METTISFGYWIRRQRKALDLTQQILADRVGCSLAAIKKIESDERRPSRQIAERLADVLGVPANQREMFLEVARGLRSVDQLAMLHEPAISSPPSGTVTFLYTDIEGSTRLAQEHPEEWETLRARHHAILRDAIGSNNGYVFQVIGDEFLSAFHTAEDAVRAAVKSQVALHAENWGDAPIRVRMGIHTGKAEVQEDGLYHGYVTLSHVQRVMSVGHGGQVLLSSTTQELVQDELPEGVELRDMGQRQLKDWTHSEHIFQLVIPDLRADFPPLKIPESFPHNLPIQLTSFIGRERELAEVKQLLSSTRLLTLTGPGGTGKTRLSLRLAADILEEFTDGVWLVELAPLTDPTLVTQTVASTLGVREQPGRTILEALMGYMRAKTILLILDNCEHLIEACARLAETLLHSCPDLHILATSREALSVDGETLYLVPTLTIPDPVDATAETLADYEAVQLFVERAQATLSNFSITHENAPMIAHVCHYLDGIPLALELAAARVKGLSIEQIASRVNDRFRLLTSGSRTALPRHQTLQALIDWSHNLLSESECVLLRRLSVFAGGWTLEAAESVCADDGLESDQILDLLLGLVDKSLVLAETQGAEPRYHMLETIRQYAREKLWAAGEGEMMRQRHLAYFVDLAERAEPNLRAFDMVMWLDRLEAEHDNMRAALEWALESNAEAVLQLAGALWWFWHIRDHKSEGAEWLERALSIEEMERGDQPLTPSSAMIQGKALYVAGFLRHVFLETDKGAALSGKSLTLFQQLGPAGKQGMAYALWNLAVVAAQQSDRLRQKTLMEESLALFKEVGDKFGIAQCLIGIGDSVLVIYDDYKRALTLMEEGLALYKEIGDKDGLASALTNLGDLAFWKGDYKQATTRFEASIAMFREVGDKYGLTEGLFSLGEAARLQGRYDKATTVLEESLALARDSGDKFRTAYHLYTLGEVAVAQGDYESAARRYEEGLAIAQETGNPGLSAYGFCGLGGVALVQGDYEQATRKFEGALAASRKTGNKFGTALALLGLGRVARSQGHLVSAREFNLEAIVIFREEVGNSMDATQRVAHCLVAFAFLAVTQKQMRRATYLFGAAETLFTPVRYTMSSKERAEHDQAIATARATLGEEAFAAVWAKGKVMTMKQAIECALETENESKEAQLPGE